MRRILILTILTCVTAILMPPACVAQGGCHSSSRGGPWINYSYPLFRSGNRPPEARNYSQDYFWPYDVYETYPKYYGGFHARYFDEIGYPSGDRGLRGTAW